MLNRTALTRNVAIKLLKMRFACGILVMRCSGMMALTVRDSTQRNMGKTTAKVDMAAITTG